MIRRTPDLDDLDREIRDHIDAETEDNIARGMSPDEARAGGDQEVRQRHAREGGRARRLDPGWVDQLRQDARDAAALRAPQSRPSRSRSS